MAITRTSMVDDDGSGTTGTIINNAWKTELYNQIDALAGGNALTWTPVDASGAGLTLTNYGSYYSRNGNVVWLVSLIAYPATANGSDAKLGGLPFTVGYAASGCYSTFGVANVFHLPLAATNILPFNPTTGIQRTNAQLSSLVIGFAGLYFAA